MSPEKGRAGVLDHPAPPALLFGQDRTNGAILPDGSDTNHPPRNPGRPHVTGVSRVRGRWSPILTPVRGGRERRTRWLVAPQAVEIDHPRSEGDLMSMSELPTREQLQIAISPWWRGGGTASLMVDVLRQGEGSLDEARGLAEEMARRAAAGNRFINREVVEEHLEMVRASAALSFKAVSKDQSKISRTSPLGKAYPGLVFHADRGWIRA